MQTFIFLSLTNKDNGLASRLLTCNLDELQVTRVDVLPESFAAAWHGSQAPQQTHVLLSFVRAPEAEVICHCRTGKSQKKAARQHRAQAAGGSPETTPLWSLM